MDNELFSALCTVRKLMAQREWVCARNYLDKIMQEIHDGACHE